MNQLRHTVRLVALCVVFLLAIAGVFLEYQRPTPPWYLPFLRILSPEEFFAVYLLIMLFVIYHDDEWSA